MAGRGGGEFDGGRALSQVELNMLCNEREVASMIVDCFPQTSAKKKSSLSAERSSSRSAPPNAPKFVPQLLKRLAGMTDIVSSEAGASRTVPWNP